MSGAILAAISSLLGVVSNTKNIVSKTWSLQASFDGVKYGLYPNGDKPAGYQTAPTLLANDVADGQITGGINGNGVPIRLFGYSFGTRSNLGLTTGAKVYFRDPLGDNLWHECAYYWYLSTSKVYSKLQIQELCIEPGALGGSMVNGRSLDIKVTVNGTDTNILTAAFKIQPGNFFYVDHQNGSDTTGAVNDKTKPFQHLQVYNTGTSSYTGLWASLTSTGGDTILVKGTTSDNLGVEGKYCRFYSKTGSVADGTTGKGSIKILNWPTTSGASTWSFTGPAADNGGIHGSISGHYGTDGKYVTLSGFTGAGNATGNSDAAPINGQYGAIGWRVFNCESQWQSTVTGTNHARAGAIAGEWESSLIFGCHLHDVWGDSNQENHGIYIGDGANVCSKNVEIAYCYIHDITAGSGIQCNNSAASDTFQGIKTHHCWIENVAKYSINANNTVLSWDVWNNILVNPSKNIFRVGTPQASAVLNFVHNTCVQSSTNNSYTGMTAQESAGITSGTTSIKHNIFYKANNTGGLTFTSFGSGDTGVAMAENLYFDVTGTETTAPSKDTTGIYGDPKFTDFVNKLLTLQTGSPAIDACASAEVIAVASDFYGMARPVTGTSAPGASKNDIGATEGVGV
jgi:hypothetical protein